LWCQASLGEHTDATFVVDGGVEIHAHKAVLAANVPAIRHILVEGDIVVLAYEYAAESVVADLKKVYLEGKTDDSCRFEVLSSLLSCDCIDCCGARCANAEMDGVETMVFNIVSDNVSDVTSGYLAGPEILLPMEDVVVSPETSSNKVVKLSALKRKRKRPPPTVHQLFEIVAEKKHQTTDVLVEKHERNMLAASKTTATANPHGNLQKFEENETAEEGDISYKHIATIQANAAASNSPHCEFCSKLIPPAQMKAHVATHFPNQWKMECVVCKLVFSHQKSFDKHNLTTHGTTIPMVAPLSSSDKLPTKKRGGIKCHLCVGTENRAMRYGTSEELSVHHSKAHYEMDYICDICSEVTVHWSLYEKHLRDHVTDNACPFCGKTFRVVQLKRKKEGEEEATVQGSRLSCFPHLYLHMDPAYFRFKCDFCDDKFYSAIKKQEHENQQHTGNKSQFVCEICDKGFTTSARRAVHKRTAHRMKTADKDPYLPLYHNLKTSGGGAGKKKKKNSLQRKL